MSGPTVKWGQLDRYLQRHNFHIYTKGGDKIIRHHGKTVRIGHKFCNHYGDQLLPAHLSALKRVFGIGVEDILTE